MTTSALKNLKANIICFQNSNDCLDISWDE